MFLYTICIKQKCNPAAKQGCMILCLILDTIANAASSSCNKAQYKEHKEDKE
jgi:hypothetical protein